MSSLRHRHRHCAYVTNINIAATYHRLYLQQCSAFFFVVYVCPPPTYIMLASLTLTDTQSGLLHISFLCIIIRTGYSPLNCGARYPCVCVCGPHKRMRRLLRGVPMDVARDGIRAHACQCYSRWTTATTTGARFRMRLRMRMPVINGVLSGVCSQQCDI